MSVSEPGVPPQPQSYQQPGQYPEGGAYTQSGIAPAGWQQPGKVGTPTAVGKGILLFIVTLGIYGLIWTYRQFTELKEYSGEGVGGPVGLIIQLFVGFVNLFLLPSEVEKNLYQRNGRQSPVSAATGAWIFVPLAGGIIWYVKVQKAINEFWVSQGATAV